MVRTSAPDAHCSLQRRSALSEHRVRILNLQLLFNCSHRTSLRLFLASATCVNPVFRLKTATEFVDRTPLERSRMFRYAKSNRIGGLRRLWNEIVEGKSLGKYFAIKFSRWSSSSIAALRGECVVGDP